MPENLKNPADVSAVSAASGAGANSLPGSRSFRVELAEGVCWVRPCAASLTLAWSEVGPAVERLVDLTRGQPVPRVIFDLGDVEWFDSAYLSLMLECWREVDLRSGVMGLCRVAPAARELLRLVALDTMWPIHSDAQQAKAAILANAPASVPSDAVPKGTEASPGANTEATIHVNAEPVAVGEPGPTDVVPIEETPTADGRPAT